MPRKKKKIDINKLSPKDRVNTVTHLAETVDYNSRHVAAHAKEAKAQARSKDPKAKESVKFNTDHLVKHAKDVSLHAKKLTEHLGKYPSVKAAQKELAESPASRKIRPIKKS